MHWDCSAGRKIADGIITLILILRSLTCPRGKRNTTIPSSTLIFGPRASPNERPSSFANAPPNLPSGVCTRFSHPCLPLGPYPSFVSTKTHPPSHIGQSRAPCTCTFHRSPPIQYGPLFLLFSTNPAPAHTHPCPHFCATFLLHGPPRFDPAPQCRRSRVFGSPFCRAALAFQASNRSSLRAPGRVGITSTRPSRIRQPNSHGGRLSVPKHSTIISLGLSYLLNRQLVRSVISLTC